MIVCVRPPPRADLEAQENQSCKKTCQDTTRKLCGAVGLAILGSGMGAAAVSILSHLGPQKSLQTGVLYGAVSYFTRQLTTQSLKDFISFRNIQERPQEILEEDPLRNKIPCQFELSKVTLIAIAVGLISGWALVNLAKTDSLTIPVAAMITGN